MSYFKKILGDRIYLSPRSSSLEEVEQFTRWLNDFDITDYVGKSNQVITFSGEKDYHSKGYGTEAINLILEYGFKYLNLHSIKLDLVSANERAHKSYLKCGFKE